MHDLVNDCLSGVDIKIKNQRRILCTISEKKKEKII